MKQLVSWFSSLILLFSCGTSVSACYRHHHPQYCNDSVFSILNKMKVKNIAVPPNTDPDLTNTTKDTIKNCLQKLNPRLNNNDLAKIFFKTSDQKLVTGSYVSYPLLLSSGIQTTTTAINVLLSRSTQAIDDLIVTNMEQSRYLEFWYHNSDDPVYLEAAGVQNSLRNTLAWQIPLLTRFDLNHVTFSNQKGRKQPLAKLKSHINLNKDNNVIHAKLTINVPDDATSPPIQITNVLIVWNDYADKPAWTTKGIKNAGQPQSPLPVSLPKGTVFDVTNPDVAQVMKKALGKTPGNNLNACIDFPCITFLHHKDYQIKPIPLVIEINITIVLPPLLLRFTNNVVPPAVAISGYFQVDFTLYALSFSKD